MIFSLLQHRLTAKHSKPDKAVFRVDSPPPDYSLLIYIAITRLKLLFKQQLDKKAVPLFPRLRVQRGKAIAKLICHSNLLGGESRFALKHPVTHCVRATPLEKRGRINKHFHYILYTLVTLNFFTQIYTIF